MGLKDRLLKFIDSEGISTQAFEKAVDLSNGSVSKMGDNTRTSTLDKISNKYPSLNIDWLRTGKGEMYLTQEDDKTMGTESNASDKVIPSYMTYLLPISSRGGTLTGFSAPGTMLQQCEKVISPIADVDFAISVYGESMAPEYPSGSTVLIKRIDPNIFIDWGHVYVLDTPNGVILKKLIYNEQNPEMAICRSINKNPEFSDFQIKLSEVYGIYRVLMCLSVK